MNSQYKLGQQLAHHEYLREQLAERFPDADEDTLRDTLEGMTDLTDMLAEMIRSSLDDKALVTALKQREADMKERRERFETRAQKKRDLVWSMMERADIKKIAVPDLTASLRASRPSVVVSEHTNIPSGFWISAEPKLDRNKLYIALRDGHEIPGVALTNSPPTLSVRTK
jgi:hypothetical protein